SPKVEELRAWLRHAHAPIPSQLPKSLQSLDSLGCKTFMLDNTRISIICFHLDANQIAHLVTVSERDLAKPPPEHAPLYARRGEWMTASWSDRGQAFMLVMKGSEPDLRSLLQVDTAQLRQGCFRRGVLVLHGKDALDSCPYLARSSLA